QPYPGDTEHAALRPCDWPHGGELVRLTVPPWSFTWIPGRPTRSCDPRWRKTWALLGHHGRRCSRKWAMEATYRSVIESGTHPWSFPEGELLQDRRDALSYF